MATSLFRTLLEAAAAAEAATADNVAEAAASAAGDTAAAGEPCVPSAPAAAGRTAAGNTAAAGEPAAAGDAGSDAMFLTNYASEFAKRQRKLFVLRAHASRMRQESQPPAQPDNRKGAHCQA